MRRSILLLALLSAACAPMESRPGVVSASGESPLITIGAGNLVIGSGYMLTQYIVDPTAQTCWFLVNGSPAPLDCCALARVPAARPHLTWTASCGAPVAAPPSVPPASAPPS